VAIGEVQQPHLTEPRQLIETVGFRRVSANRESGRRGSGQHVQKFAAVHLNDY
jgi:hypothetical protein